MGGAYFKLHIGINISAIQESNEKKTSMEVATFLREMDGVQRGGGGGG